MMIGVRFTDKYSTRNMHIALQCLMILYIGRKGIDPFVK